MGLYKKYEDEIKEGRISTMENENEDAVDETLDRLGVDYVDLLYIHQPAGNWLAGYRQLEKAYRDGKAKSIGISNFEGKYIEELQTKWEIVPQLMQVEAHTTDITKETKLKNILAKYPWLKDELYKVNDKLIRLFDFTPIY